MVRQLVTQHTHLHVGAGNVAQSVGNNHMVTPMQHLINNVSIGKIVEGMTTQCRILSVEKTCHHLKYTGQIHLPKYCKYRMNNVLRDI